MPISAELIQSIENNTYTQKELNLEAQGLEKEDILVLASALKKNNHIKSVNLSNNPINFEAIEKILCLDQLEELDVSETLLTGSDMVNFEKTNLKKLSVNGISLGEKGVESIAKMENLTDLSVEECRITNTGFQLLTRPNSPLKKLKIGKNIFNADALKNIGENQTLAKLSLCHMGLPHTVANFILENRTLEELDLSHNYLANEGATIIANHPSITHLDLSDNLLSNSILAVFANKKIKTLILFNNELDSKGAKEFVSTTLTKLNLAANKLDDDCAEALASISSLKELNLSMNSITEKGAKILSKLCDSPSFQKIHLGANPIPQALLIEFATFNKRNRQLENSARDVQPTAAKRSKT